MSEILFSSLLHREYRDDLQSLMFFNPNQALVTPSIIESIDIYGVPRIVVEGEYLRLRVRESSDVQSLYALLQPGAGKPDLVGVIVYTRAESEALTLLHIAVTENYASSGELLAVRLLSRLREIARQIRGVRSLCILYGEGVMKKIPVRAVPLPQGDAIPTPKQN